jgi:hypothetical protein
MPVGTSPNPQSDKPTDSIVSASDQSLLPDASPNIEAAAPGDAVFIHLSDTNATL